jgi:hypothetical protein
MLYFIMYVAMLARSSGGREDGVGDKVSNLISKTINNTLHTTYQYMLVYRYTMRTTACYHLPRRTETYNIIAK